MDSFQAIIIAIIEGLTEYLPVSSTAHMIFTSSFFGIQDDEFVKMFQVSIQFGAILAVVALYWKKFFDFKNIGFYIKLAFAVAPAFLPPANQCRKINGRQMSIFHDRHGRQSRFSTVQLPGQT